MSGSASDLTPLLADPGGGTVTHFDPAFPDRTLLLHAARPRHCDAATPIVFVHHGVARNG